MRDVYPRIWRYLLTSVFWWLCLIETATKAGYDPEAAVTLWQKMGDLSEDRPAEFLSTHPAPENRQAALNTMIPRMLQVNPDRTKAPIHPVTIVQ